MRCCPMADSQLILELMFLVRVHIIYQKVARNDSEGMDTC